MGKETSNQGGESACDQGAKSKVAIDYDHKRGGILRVKNCEYDKDLVRGTQPQEKLECR